MYLFRNSFCLVWIFGLMMPLAMGQDPLGGKDSLVLENERIEDVIESDKPFIKPPYQEIEQGEGERMNYQSKDFYVETDFEPAPPDIMPVEREKKPNLKHNMLKLGFGRFVTPTAQLFLNNGRDRNVDYGLDFTHISAHRDVIPLRKFREDYGNLRLNLLEKEYKLAAKAHVYSTTYFPYADTVFQNDATRREDSLRQGFTRFELSANLATNYDPRSAYDYDLGAALRVLGGPRGNREIHIHLLPSGAYYLTEDIKVGITSDFNVLNARVAGANEARIFLDAAPYVAFDNGLLSLQGGFRFNFFRNNADTVSFDQFGAVIKASYAIIPEKFEFQAGYLTGMTHNHLYDMIYENRYLEKSVLIRPTIERMNIYAGLKGNIGNQIDATARVFYKRIENQLIYTTPEEGAYFSAAYDSLMTVTGTQVELNYDLEDEFTAGVVFNLNFYNTSTVEKYFHAAPLRLDVFGIYQLNEQLTVKGEVFVFGDRPMSIDQNGEVIRQGFFVDVNASADYQITKGFSVFVAINNLLNSNYQRWHNYPERRFDISGGLGLAF